MEDKEILKLFPDYAELNRELNNIQDKAAGCSRCQSSEETYWRIEQTRFWKKISARLAEQVSGMKEAGV